jgi:hypothetical protein
MEGDAPKGVSVSVGTDSWSNHNVRSNTVSVNGTGLHNSASIRTYAVCVGFGCNSIVGGRVR